MNGGNCSNWLPGCDNPDEYSVDNRAILTIMTFVHRAITRIPPHLHFAVDRAGQTSAARASPVTRVKHGQTTQVA